MSKAASSLMSDSIKSQEQGNATPPMRATTSQSRQMRIKTLPNDIIMEHLNKDYEAHTFNLGTRQMRLSSHKSTLSMEKGSNEIQYFELNLKDIIDKANPQKNKIIKKPQSDSYKQNLTMILGDFMMKLENVDENQIEQTFLSSLRGHFQNVDKKNSRLTALMDYSINELSGKLKQNSQTPSSKLCKQKRLKDFFNYKYNKTSHKPPVASKENPNNSQVIDNLQILDGYLVKKMTKTLIDQQGNQFKVTVQKLN